MLKAYDEKDLCTRCSNQTTPDVFCIRCEEVTPRQKIIGAILRNKKPLEKLTFFLKLHEVKEAIKKADITGASHYYPFFLDDIPEFRNIEYMVDSEINENSGRFCQEIKKVLAQETPCQ